VLHFLCGSASTPMPCCHLIMGWSNTVGVTDTSAYGVEVLSLGNIPGYHLWYSTACGWKIYDGTWFLRITLRAALPTPTWKWPPLSSCS
jgi:hypothetical protein